jgi:hypothetical protein
MSGEKKSLVSRILGGIVGLLSTGGIGDDGPPPDMDGRRDTDSEYRQSVLTTKSQMTPHGMGTTSYEQVERANKDD